MNSGTVIYIPSTTGGENFAAILIDTNVELANDPAQATRITHRDVSSPDMNAYRALRISHWRSAPYIDSDRCLTSYSVGMDDGMPRLANTLPRRKKATFALRKAYCPAFTSSCETLLATASTCLDSRRGILRAARRHIPHGSRDSPKSIQTRKMEQGETAAEAAHKAHTLPLLGTCYISLNLPNKERNDIEPCAVASLCLWKPAQKKKRGTSSSPSWRYLRGMAAPHPHPPESVVLRTNLGRVGAMPRQQANLLFRHFTQVSRATLPYILLLHAALPCPPSGGWEMDRPLTPYELEMTVRDASLGSAPGSDNMLNEFLHRLGPVARGTLRTMIHNSFANGSLPGSWENGGHYSYSQTLEGIHAAQRVTDTSRYSPFY
ncbi:hypothetical protein MOQ_005487 [Trypanosoma cruzi marinkellei]|uniref:Trans-sialidase n=1 Tax=Trypanosoma cruzi marinkellei TaxID=85056 RepID=K2NPB6_TRYCR|nr:hypothetical protein MOQ_005487 [Trypanosoma cruzi marinkellei]